MPIETNIPKFIIDSISTELARLEPNDQREVVDYIYKHPSNYFRKLDTLTVQNFQKVDKFAADDFFINGYNGIVNINMKDNFIEHILKSEALIECADDTLIQYFGRKNYLDSQVWLRTKKSIPMETTHFLARIKGIIEHDFFAESKFLDFSKNRSYVFFTKSKMDNRVCPVRIGYGRLRNHERNNAMEYRFSSHKFDGKYWEEGTVFVLLN